MRRGLPFCWLSRMPGARWRSPITLMSWSAGVLWTKVQANAYGRIRISNLTISAAQWFQDRRPSGGCHKERGQNVRLSWEVVMELGKTISRIVLLGAAAACLASTVRPALAEDYVVGAEMALTGTYAWIGVPTREGLEVAMAESQSSSNLLTTKLTLPS